MIEHQIAAIRDRLAEAHRLIIVSTKEPGHSPTEDALIDAIRCVAAAAGELVDVIDELTKPLTDSEFHGLTLGEK